jgi:hypothetical protein
VNVSEAEGRVKHVKEKVQEEGMNNWKGGEETHLMYSTSSVALPEGQLMVLQVTSLVPWTFHPMLLRVWKLTVHAVVDA